MVQSARQRLTLIKMNSIQGGVVLVGARLSGEVMIMLMTGIMRIIEVVVLPPPALHLRLEDRTCVAGNRR